MDSRMLFLLILGSSVLSGRAMPLPEASSLLSSSSSLNMTPNSPFESESVDGQQIRSVLSGPLRVGPPYAHFDQSNSTDDFREQQSSDTRETTTRTTSGDDLDDFAKDVRKHVKTTPSTTDRDELVEKPSTSLSSEDASKVISSEMEYYAAYFRTHSSCGVYSTVKARSLCKRRAFARMKRIVSEIEKITRDSFMCTDVDKSLKVEKLKSLDRLFINISLVSPQSPSERQGFQNKSVSVARVIEEIAIEKFNQEQHCKKSVDEDDRQDDMERIDDEEMSADED